MKTNKEKRITFRVDKDIHDRLKEKAKSKEVSLSELIRESIKKGEKNG